MTTLLAILALAVLGFLAFALWVRMAPSDPARWHVDPVAAPDPATPNFARIERISPLPPDELRARIDAAARAEGAQLLTGDARHFTYIARTRLMRYPDFVSFRLEPAEVGGTHLAAFSRSRFGRSDRGVNAARLRRWLRGL
ncbi:MAG: DUF1499 domain-containing protein [Pararhodobacter sp.]|nr:DUF1499 domain-containing protein [Pararhodobacter sp.]